MKIIAPIIALTVTLIGSVHFYGWTGGVLATLGILIVAAVIVGASIKT